MRRRVDPIGRVLLRNGAIVPEQLADVLDVQRRTLPLASLCYVLGHADEESLARALAMQHGTPAVVLERCVIQLDVLEHLEHDVAIANNVLPVLEDEQRIFVAAEDPHKVRDLLREFHFVSGKSVVAHVALHVILARTIRAVYAASARGESVWNGREAELYPESGYGTMVVVHDIDASIVGDADEPIAAAQVALLEDVTKEFVDADLLAIEAADTGMDVDFQTDIGATPLGEPSSTGEAKATFSDSLDSQTPLSQIELQPPTSSHELIDLDDGDDLDLRDADVTAGQQRVPHVLIVDDDFATRHLLVKELQPLGLVTQTAPSGGEAVRMLKRAAPSLVVIDVMLPEIDGFQICRAIKRSRKYSDIPVVLMSAVIDSGRVTDEVLRRYGADAYFEKPLNTERVKRRIQDLLAARSDVAVPDDDDSFERAIQLYRDGEVRRAVVVLREGIEADPLSAKHHFVLANLLQKQANIYEAIDEYEATVDLKPDYFPALTRLAYLYYKQGFSAKAIEAWRRSLPHCPDLHLRQNIEVFMRKLISDMQAVDFA